MKKRIFLVFLLLAIAVFITICKNKAESKSADSETIGTEAKQGASIQSSDLKDGYSSVDKSISKEYPNMVRIPAGSFEMGSNDGDSDEKPVHTVYISEFWMDKYEVTNGEYKKCVDVGVCHALLESDSAGRERYFGDNHYLDYPVMYVNWDNAKKYCEWKGGRLPTEAEWEYAARGGLSGKIYPNGDGINCGDANYCRYSCTDCKGYGGRDDDTHQAGSYAANGYGLYDMTGNVWEWCSDWYDEKYYSTSPSGNPQGPSNGTYRVLRGGSWGDCASDVRVARRGNIDPAGRGNSFGFRCVR